MFKTSKNVLTATIASVLFSAGVQAANLADWNEDTTYDKDQKVNYHGLTYQAKWWTEDDMPSADAAGPWRLVDDGKNSAYNEDFEYKKGQVVRFDGQLWQAKWHINEDTPPVESEDSGWSMLGASDPLLDYMTAIPSIDFEQDDFEDLEAIEQYIGDASIVLLGEQSHGDATTFEAKARLVKFLHQEMGFEVLAFESGLYDMARVWQDIKGGQATAEAAKNKMFYMYSFSDQLQPLFKYIDEHVDTEDELVLAGFDGQHSGAYAINETVSGLADFIGEDSIQLLPAEAVAKFTEITTQLVSFTLEVSDDTAEHAFYLDAIEQLRQLVAQTPDKGDAHTQQAEFWKLYLDNLEKQYKAWRIHGRWSNEGISLREEQMALNLTWLHQKAYSGKKIIVWGHNSHVSKGWGLLSLRSFLGELNNESYTVFFTPFKGEFNSWGNAIYPVPAQPEGSLEQRLANGDQNYGFLDLEQIITAEKWPYGIQAQHDFFWSTTANQVWTYNWWQVTDAFYFIREEKATSYEGGKINPW